MPVQLMLHYSLQENQNHIFPSQKQNHTQKELSKIRLFFSGKITHWSNPKPIPLPVALTNASLRVQKR